MVAISPIAPTTPETFTAVRQGRTWSVLSSWQGIVFEGFDCQAGAEHRAEEMQQASDEAGAEAAEAERQDAELAAIYDDLNARGGYVAPDDVEGQSRDKALSLVLDFISEKQADLRAISGRGVQMKAAA